MNYSRTKVDGIESNYLLLLKYLAMPFYRIVVELKTGKSYRGIRLINVHNPDTALTIVENKVKMHFRNELIKNIDVVMVPKRSTEVKRYLEAHPHHKNKNVDDV
jgi:hypothetical protein